MQAHVAKKVTKRSARLHEVWQHNKTANLKTSDWFYIWVHLTLKTTHLLYSLWGFGVIQSHRQFKKHWIVNVIFYQIYLQTTRGQATKRLIQNAVWLQIVFIRITGTEQSLWCHLAERFFLIYPRPIHPLPHLTSTYGQGCSMWHVLCCGPWWWPVSKSEMKEKQKILSM